MTPKSSPFSIRLTAATDELVNEQARRTRRSKSAVVEALTEEAVKVRLFPGVGFRGSDSERRPWVIGTGLDVWELVLASRDFESPQDMAKRSDLLEAQIRLALAYYKRFPEEVDRDIQLGRRPIQALLDEYPHLSKLGPE